MEPIRSLKYKRGKSVKRYAKTVSFATTHWLTFGKSNFKIYAYSYLLTKSVYAALDETNLFIESKHLSYFTIINLV